MHRNQRAPGGTIAQTTDRLGQYLRDVLKLNEAESNFRVFGPDETASNRLQAVYETTNKQWMGAYEPNDAEDPMGRVGQVMEMLSEHQCQGWLEGYLLTGRHGLMSSYEAFIHIVDSMFNQHAKWLKVTNEIPWRRPISSLNYLLSSHVWRQDHNGFSHQDPGFIDHVVNKKAEVVRVYLPPDANTLLSTFDHVLRTEQYVNVVVAGKQPNPVWLTMDEAVRHCARGLGIWEWAGTEVAGEEPDVVLGIAALVAVPQVHEGRLRSVVYVNQCEPRVWTHDEVSLVENLERAPLHPLDQFRAFQDMRVKGKTEEEIAATASISAGDPQIISAVASEAARQNVLIKELGVHPTKVTWANAWGSRRAVSRASNQEIATCTCHRCVAMPSPWAQRCDTSSTLPARR